MRRAGSVVVGFVLGCVLGWYPIRAQVTNPSVQSITGTANQVIASSATGAVTLSLPQSIATTSNPIFGWLSFDNTLLNTKVGSGALAAVTSGHDSTAVGHAALASMTTGYENIAIGEFALNALTTSRLNIAIGWNALNNSVDAEDNVAIGRQTLVKTGGFYDNTVVGSTSGQQITGHSNTGIGFAALMADVTASGNYNIGVGNYAGYTITSGSHNIAIGNTATVDDVTATDQLVIGSTSNGGGGYFFAGNIGTLRVGPSLQLANGKAVQADTTTAHTALLQAYDVDGTAYKTFGTLTNGNTPDFTIAAPAGGTITLQPTTYKSSDGSTGVTVAACTSFKNGLCVAGT